MHKKEAGPSPRALDLHQYCRIVQLLPLTQPNSTFEIPTLPLQSHQFHYIDSATHLGWSLTYDMLEGHLCGEVFDRNPYEDHMVR